MLARYYCLILLLIISTVTAGQKQPRLDKPASWVTLNSIAYNQSHLDEEAEYGYIDLDYERQVSVADQSEYFRTVMKIITEAGIENASEISVSYDPSYSQLVFHNIYIIRDGKKINKLSSAKFKMLQQEKELDRHLYNGRVYAMLALSDVRKGDIIEYAYTLPLLVLSPTGIKPMIFSGTTVLIIGNRGLSTIVIDICNLLVTTPTKAEGKGLDFAFNLSGLPGNGKMMK